MTAHTRRQPNAWWVAVVAGMASFIDGAAIVGFGISIVIFQGTLQLNEVQVGVASAALTVGIAVGALLGGRLGDRYGRRPVFTITMVMILLAFCGLMLAPTFSVLLISAILLGLGAGGDLPVSLSTISEAASDTNRGRLLGLSNLLWLAGAVAGSFLGSAAGALGASGIYLIYGSLAGVAALTLLARLTIPESENWKAAQAERKAGTTTVRADKANVQQLFRGPYAKPFFALIGFYALVNLAANTGGQYGTYVLVNYGGVPIERAAILGLPLLPLTLITMLWFMKIADKPVRFVYFTIGAIAQVLSLLTFAVAGVSVTTYLISTALASLGTAFAFEGIMKVWTQTSFPTLLRTTAQGIIISVARFFAAALAGVTPLLLLGGPSVLYGILAALTFVGSAWAWIVFRTRNTHNEFDTETAADPEPQLATSGSSPMPTS